MKPIPFDQITLRDRILVLEWMKTAIHSGIEGLIGRKTYRHFCRCLEQDKPFEPIDVWNQLEPQTQDHFNHSRTSVERLETAIKDCQHQIHLSHLDQQDEIDEEVAETKERMEVLGPNEGIEL